MSEAIPAIRGMSDVLPGDTGMWQHVEGILKATVHAYGYRELRVPVVERTELFKRSIGEVTDIVEKEMYTFADRNNESLTLRPEATAGIVRAGISHGLFHNQQQKLWSMGPMFRYEKPQKGRYRQFHQFDVEAFGFAGPDIDAELLMLIARIWRNLGLTRIELQLNSLGTPASRVRYRAELTDYFSAHVERLDPESRERLGRNPLRLLDSNAQMLRLNSLITSHAVLEQLRGMIRQPYGIILVVGPTGSGKSTTLYSAINEINTEGVNIVTAEDPIEYTLPGIHQVQIVREKGVDFARILRAFMRQDPDVMLVGETRDPETAKTSMEAALTGHLVFSTLHANTATSAVTRLAEMGVPN